MARPIHPSTRTLVPGFGLREMSPTVLQPADSSPESAMFFAGVTKNQRRLNGDDADLNISMKWWSDDEDYTFVVNYRVHSDVVAEIEAFRNPDLTKPKGAVNKTISFFSDRIAYSDIIDTFWDAICQYGDRTIVPYAFHRFITPGTNWDPVTRNGYPDRRLSSEFLKTIFCRVLSEIMHAIYRADGEQFDPTMNTFMASFTREVDRNYPLVRAAKRGRDVTSGMEIDPSDDEADEDCYVSEEDPAVLKKQDHVVKTLIRFIAVCYAHDIIHTLGHASMITYMDTALATALAPQLKCPLYPEMREVRDAVIRVLFTNAIDFKSNSCEYRDSLMAPMPVQWLFTTYICGRLIALSVAEFDLPYSNDGSPARGQGEKTHPVTAENALRFENCNAEMGELAGPAEKVVLLYWSRTLKMYIHPVLLTFPFVPGTTETYKNDGLDMRFVQHTVFHRDVYKAYIQKAVEFFDSRRWIPFHQFCFPDLEPIVYCNEPLDAEWPKLQQWMADEVYRNWCSDEYRVRHPQPFAPAKVFPIQEDAAAGVTRALMDIGKVDDDGDVDIHALSTHFLNTSEVVGVNDMSRKQAHTLSWLLWDHLMETMPAVKTKITMRVYEIFHPAFLNFKGVHELTRTLQSSAQSYTLFLSWLHNLTKQFFALDSERLAAKVGIDLDGDAAWTIRRSRAIPVLPSIICKQPWGPKGLIFSPDGPSEELKKPPGLKPVLNPSKALPKKLQYYGDVFPWDADIVVMQ